MFVADRLADALDAEDTSCSLRRSASAVEELSLWRVRGHQEVLNMHTKSDFGDEEVQDRMIYAFDWEEAFETISPSHSGLGDAPELADYMVQEWGLQHHEAALWYLRWAEQVGVINDDPMGYLTLEV